jgi:hypothetical protein
LDAHGWPESSRLLLLLEQHGGAAIRHRDVVVPISIQIADRDCQGLTDARDIDRAKEYARDRVLEQDGQTARITEAPGIGYRQIRPAVIVEITDSHVLGSRSGGMADGREELAPRCWIVVLDEDCDAGRFGIGGRSQVGHDEVELSIPVQIGHLDIDWLVTGGVCSRS